jgi:uncharacterized protein (TIGR02246 family)
MVAEDREIVEPVSLHRLTVSENTMTNSPNQEGKSTNQHLDTDQYPDIDADESAIRELYQQLMDGWNQGSGDAFASVFTEGGDLIGFDGTHFQGRAEIASSHQVLFDKWLKGTWLVGRVENVMFPADDVAVVHAVGGTIMPGKSNPSPERDSIQTLVATKHEGEWRFTAFQNTRVRPMGQNLAAVVVWKLSDVLWKVSQLHKGSAPNNLMTMSE